LYQVPSTYMYGTRYMWSDGLDKISSKYAARRRSKRRNEFTIIKKSRLYMSCMHII
jgi:hypothetical protein